MKVKQSVLEVLSAAVCRGKELELTGQLDRKLYLDTNNVLEACGGKWNRKAKAHVFGEEAQPLIDTVIVTGEVRTHREDGWFPTPPDLADRLAVETPTMVSLIDRLDNLEHRIHNATFLLEMHRI